MNKIIICVTVILNLMMVMGSRPRVIVNLSVTEKTNRCHVLFCCRFSVVAPQQLRVGTKENVLVEALNAPDPVTVSLSLFESPGQSVILWQGALTLDAANSFSALQSIEVVLQHVHPLAT